MMVTTTEPPIAVVPPFVLPDIHGKTYNSARLRGCRHTILLFLTPEDADAPAYLASFAARREELAWLHTAVVVIIPAHAESVSLPALPFPILRDDGAMRAHVLPAVAPDVLVLLVADQYGQVHTWRTARRVASLPDIEAALAWAWDVARPKGSCGGVTWAATAETQPPPPPPAPVGRFAIGARSRSSRFGVRSSK